MYCTTKIIEVHMILGLYLHSFYCFITFLSFGKYLNLLHQYTVNIMKWAFFFQNSLVMYNTQNQLGIKKSEYFTHTK